MIDRIQRLRCELRSPGSHPAGEGLQRHDMGVLHQPDLVVSLPFLVPFAHPSLDTDSMPPSIIEMTVGIVCACLPCLRALAKHHFPDAFRWLDRPEPSNYGVIYAISMRIRSWRWTDRGSRTRVASSTFTDTRKSGGHRPLGSAAMEVDGVGLRGDVSVDGHLPEGTGEV